MLLDPARLALAGILTGMKTALIHCSGSMAPSSMGSVCLANTTFRLDSTTYQPSAGFTKRRCLPIYP